MVRRNELLRYRAVSPVSAFADTPTKRRFTPSNLWYTDFILCYTSKVNMASLIESNPYLRDPEQRRKMLEEDARQSSIFEGARLPKSTDQSEEGSRRKIASCRRRILPGRLLFALLYPFRFIALIFAGVGVADDAAHAGLIEALEAFPPL